MPFRTVLWAIEVTDSKKKSGNKRIHIFPETRTPSALCASGDFWALGV